MQSEALKPCPFCGGNNLRFRLSDIEGWIAHVECTDCDDMLGPMSEWKHDEKEDAEKDAAAVWNKRAALEAALSAAGTATETKIDEAARYLRETLQSGKNLKPWAVTDKGTKRKWLKLAHGTIEAALSAQVQDVAGWQTMDTAPKDGTPVVLWTVWAGDEISPDPFSEVQIGYWDHGNDLPESHEFSRRPEWVVQRIGDPTHWMPLPAAPAKQEGGHD